MVQSMVYRDRWHAAHLMLWSMLADWVVNLRDWRHAEGSVIKPSDCRRSMYSEMARLMQSRATI